MFSFKSDGTPQNTKVYCDGKEVKGVVSLRFDINASCESTMILEVLADQAEILMQNKDVSISCVVETGEQDFELISAQTLANLTAPFTAPAKGDYVLATKYADADSRDQWSVGFYDYRAVNVDGSKRYSVVDNQGRKMRASGFRAVCKISKEEGKLLLLKREIYERSKCCMWQILQDIRNERS